jgi:hypothetical protein
MTHITAMTERKKFEAWIKTLEGHPFAGAFANLMWKAWQASLTAALAEPSEPVAFICCGEVYLWPSTDPHCAHVDMHIPLYTHPPVHQPLTEFERMQIIGNEFPLALVETIIIQKVDSVCIAIENAVRSKT